MIENLENMKDAAMKNFQDGVEKMTANLSEASTQSQANIEAVVQSTQIISKALTEVAAIATQHSKAAFEKGLEVAKTLGTTKDIKDAAEIQSEYAKTLVANWVADFNKISEIMTNSGKDAVKPVSERATELMSKMKASAE
jgi:phasin family protein